MSIIDRILGRGPGPAAPSASRPAGAAQTTAPRTTTGPGASPAPATIVQQARAAELPIRVYDQFGRALEMGREAWRRDVLLPNLAVNRDKPDALYDLVVNALNDDFAADVLESARHLAASDPKPPRAANLLAVVLLQVEDFAGARDVLERALTRHADDAYLLANLARAYAALGDDERAERLIWLAMASDPNAESSLGWLIGFASRRGGQKAALDAYARAASLPGSWRAQLWLARDALDGGDLARATRLYDEALDRAHPVPADLLMQMSGDLGNRSHTQLLVQLTQPRFDALIHGLMVGNNLLRAYIELGMLPEARKLLEKLYAQQRPDWREHLLYWDEKLNEAEKRYGEVAAPIEVVVLEIEQPFWARGELGFAALLPAKAPIAPRVHFVCGTGVAAERADEKAGEKVIVQPTDDVGRLTRALPLFVSEELHLRSAARATVLMPWIKQGGFVLSSQPWTLADLPKGDDPPDLYVFMHLDARTSPWSVDVRIENPHGGPRPQTFRRPLDASRGSADVSGLSDEIRQWIESALHSAMGEPAHDLPAPDYLPVYLVALEQALAVTLAARQEATANFLYQERAIFDHLFDVALKAAELVRPRLLLLSAMDSEARRRPDIVAEYLGKLALLQEKHPLPAGTGSELIAAAAASLREKAR